MTGRETARSFSTLTLLSHDSLVGLPGTSGWGGGAHGVEAG